MSTAVTIRLDGQLEKMLKIRKAMSRENPANLPDGKDPQLTQQLPLHM